MGDTPDVARGRAILLTLIVALLGASALIIGIYLRSMPATLNSPAGQSAIATRAIRFLLTVVLMVALYRGSVIAKWIAVALFGLSLLIMIPATILAPMMAPLTLLYAAFVSVLLVSRDVDAFLEDQRSGR